MTLNLQLPVDDVVCVLCGMLEILENCHIILLSYAIQQR